MKLAAIIMKIAQNILSWYLFALVPPIACHAHPFTLWMLLMVGTTIGVEAHSGYTGHYSGSTTRLPPTNLGKTGFRV